MLGAWARSSSSSSGSRWSPSSPRPSSIAPPVRARRRTALPGGSSRTVADLRARVTFDGRSSVRGKRVLLAGGNGIGGNANQSVCATLICEAAAPFTLRSTHPAGVRRQPNGDFRIDDVLTPAPAGCASPVLLIRNTGGAWFAAGIEDLDD